MKKTKFRTAVRAVALMLMLCMALSLSAFGAAAEGNYDPETVLIILADTELVRSLEFYPLYSDDPSAGTGITLVAETELIRSQLDLGIDFTEMRILNASYSSRTENGLYKYQGSANNIFAITLGDISVGEAIEILNANPNIEIAEPNYLYDLTDPSDPGSAWMSYDDVSEDDWFYGDVEYAHNNRIMGGMAAGKFEPESPMSRAMAVTIINRAAGSPKPSVIYDYFDDVPEDQWYTDAVIWAYRRFIVNGRAEGQFEPDANVTRAEFATMLFRYAKSANLKLSDSKFCEFEDEKAIPDYAKQAVRLLHQSDIINGKDHNNFDPSANITRAEAAAMIRRFINNTKKQSGGLLGKYGLRVSDESIFRYDDPNKIVSCCIRFTSDLDSSEDPEIQIVSAKITCSHKADAVEFTETPMGAYKRNIFTARGFDADNFHDSDMFVISLTIRIGDETQDMMIYSDVGQFIEVTIE